jgi:hypothetical protein
MHPAISAPEKALYCSAQIQSATGATSPLVAKSLERLHEEEAGWAIEYFDRAPSLDMAAIIGHGGLKGSSHRP